MRAFATHLTLIAITSKTAQPPPTSLGTYPASVSSYPQDLVGLLGGGYRTCKGFSQVGHASHQIGVGRSAEPDLWHSPRPWETMQPAYVSLWLRPETLPKGSGGRENANRRAL
jgi:hypothetical protein